ncbi:MAG: hypothetical protein ACHP91_11860, partial [Burkholderiales bacterium]
MDDDAIRFVQHLRVACECACDRAFRVAAPQQAGGTEAMAVEQASRQQSSRRRLRVPPDFEVAKEDVVHGNRAGKIPDELRDVDMKRRIAHVIEHPVVFVEMIDEPAGRADGDR